MEKIILTFFVIASVVAAEGTIYMKGKLTDILLKDSGCDFKINDRSSPSTVENPRFCHFLDQAYQEKQSLSIQVRVANGNSETNNFQYSISFLDNPATWPSTEMKYELHTFKYQLVGKVTDVRYYTQGDKCYIAIDTGLPVRNNNMCDIAVSAFYSKDTVSVMASVDLHAGYANDVIALKLTKECK